MGLDKSKTIFIFDSIHYVLKAEKILKTEDLPCELIPVPREISSDCGMAIAMDKENSDTAKQKLAAHHLEFAIHQKMGKSYLRGSG